MHFPATFFLPVHRVFLFFFSLLPALCVSAATPPVDRAEVVGHMHRVVTAQLQAYGSRLPLDWRAGTFFTGVLAAHQATGDQSFHDAARAWSEKAGWKTKGSPFFADDICIAQTYLDLYLQHRDPRMIADIRAKLERYFGKPTVTAKETRQHSGVDGPKPFIGRNVWWWCDALYMAPPLLVRLHAATGDDRYLDLLHQLYWDTVDYLYVPADGLFLRDGTFLGARSPAGRNIYWSRGNGWVYAGLVRVLDHLPASDPRRADYLRLYRELTAAILRHQGEDGLWRSALGESEWFPGKESSGTSFFCYGLLAGVNRGWLPRETHLEPALKAWRGLLTCLLPDGRLGYAQPVDHEPNPAPADHSIDYAHGAFLLAASELLALAPASAPVARPSSAAPAVDAPLSVASPDGTLVATVSTGPADRALACSVTLDGRELFRFASLGLVADGVDLGLAPRLAAPPEAVRIIDETYPWQGARSTVRNHARELVVPLQSGPRSFKLIVRAYDDGVALRYDLGEREASISSESTSWILPAAGRHAWSAHVKDYESVHHFTPWSRIPVHQPLAPPFTTEANGVYLSATEADCRDFPDLALVNDGARLSIRFPGQNKPWRSALSPWRAVVVARDLTSLATTDLVKNLCAPPEASRDFSWVRPGRVLWQWWSSGAPKLEEQPAWFDAAASLTWEYYLIDDGWRNWSAPGKDQWQLLGEAIAYGKSKGVQSIVWVDSKEMLQPAARRAYLERVANLGAAGIKIDFLPTATADVMRWYEGALRDTADLRLLCNFHGAVKPTGLERTWPHGNTREAIRGHEHHITRYNRTLPLETDSILPFTRLVAGAADYTPTVFEPAELRGYTWSHELAQALVFTSPLIHFADHYKNYLNNPAVDLLRTIPTTWDETRVLPGSEIGGKVGFARRKGDTWWVGVVNGPATTTWDLPLSFLSGPAQATLLADVPGKPDAFDRREARISPADTITLTLPSGGGFFARLAPAPVPERL